MNADEPDIVHLILPFFILFHYFLSILFFHFVYIEGTKYLDKYFKFID
jgi:hypothetical protein